MDHSTDRTIRNLIVDMDGVLWHGETPLPGLAEFFATLEAKGLGFILATNNATKTAAQYVEKFARFGIELPPEQILGSAEATARFLARRYPAGTTVFAIGEDGLQSALQASGFDLMDGGGFVGNHEPAQLVVVGFDRNTCYRQMASAAIFIRKGAAFIGTNPDVTFPSEHGPLPGAGSILAFLEAATGTQPTVVGKPGRIMFDEALRRLGSQHSDTIMVGDRLATDIAGAKAAGMRAALLLSGVTSAEELADSDIEPDWVFAGLPELTGFLQSLPVAATATAAKNAD